MLLCGPKIHNDPAFSEAARDGKALVRGHIPISVCLIKIVSVNNVIFYRFCSLLTIVIHFVCFSIQNSLVSINILVENVTESTVKSAPLGFR